MHFALGSVECQPLRNFGADCVNPVDDASKEESYGCHRAHDSTMSTLRLDYGSYPDVCQLIYVVTHYAEGIAVEFDGLDSPTTRAPDSTWR